MDQAIGVSPNFGSIDGDYPELASATPHAIGAWDAGNDVTVALRDRGGKPQFGRTEVVVIDAGLADWQTLRDGVRAPAEVVLVRDGDGLAQVAEALRGRTGIDAIHVLSHGFPGGFVLGSVTLDAATLDLHRACLAAIGRCLSDDAEILVYSCYTASGRGEAFLAALAEITGAHVAGSYNLTGAAALGGDWELGYRSGSVLSSIPLSPAVMAEYPHTLTPLAPTYSSAAGYIGEHTCELNFSVALSETSPPLPQAFNVQVNGSPITVTGVLVTGSKVTLTLSGSALTAGDIIEFAYTDPSENNDVNAIQNTGGTDAADFSSSTIVFGGRPASAPTLSATGLSQSFIQGDVNDVDLFSDVTSNANDTGQTITGFTLTVTNVSDSLESIHLAGRYLTLNNGTTGPFDFISGSGTGSVAVSGSTATVTVTGLSYSGTDFANLIDNLRYFDASSNVTPGQRVITLTSVTDSGGSNNTGTPTSTAATINVSAQLAPTLTATGNSPSVPAHSVSGVDLFSSVTAATNDTGQTFTDAVITVSGITGSGEYLTIGGTDVGLSAGNSVSLTGLGVSGGAATVMVGLVAGVATLTISSLSRTDAQMNALIDGLSYKTTNTNTLSGSRTVSITSVTDSGPQTASLSGITSTVTLPDSTPPAAPAGLALASGSDSNTPGDGITRFNTPTLTGTAEVGSTVSVTDFRNGVSVLLGTVLVPVGGNWSFTPSSALADGVHSITATATDSSNNVSVASSAFSLTIDTIAPATPTIQALQVASDSGVMGDGITNHSRPTLTGTGEPNSTIVITGTIGGVSLGFGSAAVNGSGNWTYTPLTAVPDGAYTVSVQAKDAADNLSGSSSPLLVTIDTVAPAAPVITSTALTNTSPPVIAGTAEAGSTVSVTVTGATYTTVATGGAWTVNLATATPTSGTLTLNANGTNAVSVSVQDTAGNAAPSAATQTLTVDTTAPINPAITSPALTNTPAPVLSGTAEAGDIVTVTVAGATYVTTATGGVWSIDLASAEITSGTLALNTNGTNAVSVTAHDPSGNAAPSAATQTLTIDTTAPVAPAITSPAVTNIAAPVLTGTAEAGATVIVGVNAALYTTIATGGVWTINLATAVPTSGAPLLNTTNLIQVRAVDPAGNSGPYGPMQVLSIDVTAPIAPAITSPALTNSPAPVLSGTAEAGSTVSVTVAGATYTTVATGGLWSVNLGTAIPATGTLALNPNGANAVTATATDAASNVSPAASQTLTIDTAAPTAPVITSPAITNDTTPVIGGTAEAGSTVSVTVAGATYTTVATGGVWSIDLGTAIPASGTLALNSNGANTVTATATDAASNASPAATQTLTIDTTVPAVPSIPALAVSTDSGTVGDGLTNVTRPTVTGTGEPGSTIALAGTRNGVQFGLGTTTVGGDGKWAYTPTLAVPDGVYVVTATATDPAGNASAVSAPLTLTIDSTAPVVPAITSPALTNTPAPVLTGTAEDGDTVTVVIAGATYTTTVTGGIWTVNLATATPSSGVLALNTNGANAVSVSAHDTAGNAAPSAATQTLTIDTTAPTAPVIISPALTNTPAPVLTGAAEAGDTVTVVVGGATYTATAIGGVWTVNLATATPNSGTLALNINGTNAVSVSAHDPAGNAASSAATQTLTIDTTAPIAPVITSPTLTNTPAPILTGTAEAGDTVSVVIGGATYTTTATGGTWIVNLATATPSSGALALNTNGANAVSVSAHDTAGNAASSAATQTLTIDTTAPTAPAITSPSVTNVLAPVLTGTAEAGDTVTVVIAGATYTTTATSGVWTVNLATATPTSGALALNTNGANTVSLTARDPAGNISVPRNQTLTIDTTAPIAPVITSPTLTNTPAPVLTGTAETGDIVTVVVGGATYTTTATGGAWTVNLATATPVSGTLVLSTNGANAVSVSAHDPAGNAAPSPATQTLTIDTTAPIAPVITSPALTNTPAPVLTGTAEAGDTVTVVVAGATYTTTATGGVWTVNLATATPSSGALALNTNGANAVSVSAHDLAGNAASSAATQTLTIDTTAPIAPVITSPALTNTPAPVLTGTAEAGDTVTVVIAGATYTTTATGGVWTVNLATATPISGALALNTNGANTVSLTARDPAGNISVPRNQTLTIDTTAPIAPVITSPALTNTPAPVLTGTAETGDTVTVVIGGATYTTTATGGAWTVNLATATPVSGTLALNANGANTVSASAHDPAGNAAPSPATQTLTIDTTAPIAPAITSPALTNTPAPVLSGTAEAGDTVTVVIGGATYTTTATGGAWTVNLATATPSSGTLALNTKGSNTVSVSTHDPAGNASPTATQALNIDTAAPDAPTLAQDTTVTDPAKPVIQGAAESGSTVRLYQNGTQIGTAIATAGAWNFTYPTSLAAGTYILSATATDSAGNVSAASADLTVQVAADASYTLVVPVPGTNTTKASVYDSNGVLSTVQTTSSQGQVLTSVTSSVALVNIYDTAGTLIGTITQPSTSVFHQPIFSTTPADLAASTGSGPVGSVVNLLNETNNFVSEGNDQIIVHAGNANIMATGPSTVVTNIAANLTFYGSGTGTASVYGGSGTVIAGGGGGGGTLIGGTAGHNILASGGGTTIIVGAGDGDLLFGSNTGVDTLVGGAGAQTLVGGGGTETIVASAGDTAFGGAGSSTLFAGQAGGSTLVGGSGTSVLVADQGDTTLWGGTGHSTLWGGAGKDVLGGSADINSVTVMVGGTGDTTFIGSSGTSTAFGGTGNDTFWGGTGAMTIFEGSGQDTVIFGSGVASVTGGSGPDLYGLISGHAGGTATIANFKVGLDQVAFYGYDVNSIQRVVSGGNTILTAADNSTVILLGVTQLGPNSVT